MQKITDEFIRTHFTEDAIENGMHLYEGAIEAALYIEKLCENNSNSTDNDANAVSILKETAEYAVASHRNMDIYSEELNDSDTYYCNEFFDTYISSILGKRQGEYTVQDYCALPDDIRVELIDGVIYYMGAPSCIHQLTVGEIFRQIANFIHDNNGDCYPLLSPLDVQLNQDNKNMLQPDVGIVCDKELIKNQTNVYGAPDFVVEVISPSSKKRDYTIKLAKYQNAGVREYWIVDPYRKTVLVYFFENDVNPTIYPLDSTISVNIYNGRLVIDFSKIAQWARRQDNIVKETAEYAVYPKKKQGEYTYEDYCALPDDVRFELIDGVLIYMNSPHINHQFISGEIFRQLSNFIHDNKGKCKVFYAPVDVILDKDDKTCVQPDIGIFCNNNLISDKGTLYGAPDFVLEIISKSTSKKDYKLKPNKYKNSGVREYWIVDPYKEKVLVYFFENDINPTIYPIDAEIPIRIYEGNLNIVCNLQGEK